jgi:hypothetical protein
MVSQAAYKVIKKAAIIRVKRGEDIQDVIDSYPKLSDKQRAQLFIDLNEVIGD